ncbi:hypothetical protein SAMN04515673_1066 [Poseidonocella sedimentorum]|uniref:Uncharacterized protein n=1 Tax=Poseidonocella sedimentorum TaxID=871652 RepID=A0A1I6DXA9_9RHOB|nr:hypothetical protein SAMN04515673_1066 [Poseidonocella sedimentorum]
MSRLSDLRVARSEGRFLPFPYVTRGSAALSWRSVRFHDLGRLSSQVQRMSGNRPVRRDLRRQHPAIHRNSCLANGCILRSPRPVRSLRTKRIGRRVYPQASLLPPWVQTARSSNLRIFLAHRFVRPVRLVAAASTAAWLATKARSGRYRNCAMADRPQGAWQLFSRDVLIITLREHVRHRRAGPGNVTPMAPEVVIRRKFRVNFFAFSVC